ncbi:MAG: MCE family protein [Weeksellaceae bacterium]|uniref:MCE family protein n=2 Tax=Faecalibacter bovis TaxID=2898187 RepID=A0ABX7XDT0_9FLAO|nr:MCE family protein [Weeksellaceae bacterium]QTV06081.1 MCE family protein [Faecalibacter bovis]
MKISKEAKIGVVVLLTLISFFILFNFLKGKNMFTSGRVFKVKFDNVSGLAPSKPVSINGLRVGRVEEIKIIEDKQPIHFEVLISVEKDVEFSKNTVAEIYEPGIMSGPEVRLILDYGKDIAESGDYLPGRVAGGLLAGFQEQLGPTQTKIDSVLITLNKTLAGVDSMLDEENKQNLKVLLKNLNNTVSSFDATAKSIEKTSNSANNLIASNEKTITKTLDNANTTLASTKATIEKFGKTADKINSMELEKTIKNFEDASKNLTILLDDINKGKGTLGKLAKEDDIANELQATIKNMNVLVEDLKKNPSRYVNISVFGKKQPIQN